MLFNNDLCAKLASSLELPITFAERCKVTSVPFCIPGFNLLSCELDNFTFYTDITLKLNKMIILRQFLVKILKRFILLL